MKAEGDLRGRTKRYGLAAIRLYASLPKSVEAQIIGRQMLRSGTSAGAHYREACRARSDAEFISKMEVGLQELDETGYWLELLVDSRISHSPFVTDLLSETDQLIRIYVTMVKNVKERKG